MQPPIFALLVNPAGACASKGALSVVITCWFLLHLLGRPTISREKPADWTHYVDLYAAFLTVKRFSPAAFVVHWAASKAPVLISICCVLRLTPVDIAHCFTHACSLTSVIMLHCLCFCCWRWTYGHLLEKWKRRTFWCLNKKNQKNPPKNLTL